MKVRVSWAMRKRGVSFVLVCLYSVFRIARLWSSLPPCEPRKLACFHDDFRLM